MKRRAEPRKGPGDASAITRPLSGLGSPSRSFLRFLLHARFDERAELVFRQPLVVRIELVEGLLELHPRLVLVAETFRHLQELILGQLAVVVGVELAEDGVDVLVLLVFPPGRAEERAQGQDQKTSAGDACHPEAPTMFRVWQVGLYSILSRSGGSDMRKIVALALFAPLLALSGLHRARATGDPAPAFPGFRMQEIEAGLGVGYAVLLVDVDGDGKKDIVVVDQTRVVWYQNPTWKKRTIIDGGTKPDNVCIDAYDIDGDGKIDFALGAEWKPFNPTGTLQWLKRGKTLDEPWSVHPIEGADPSIHRIRFIDIEGTGKPALVSVPLMGKGATAKNNWTDGAPARVTAYKIPKDPAKDRWEAKVLDDSLHVCHNFCAAGGLTRRAVGYDLLVASYEGVSWLSPDHDGRGVKWSNVRIGTGNQDTP